MRKYFSEMLYTEMQKNNRIQLLTSDLGYGIFDDIRRDFPDRFFNVGSAEQLMVGMAVGMAMEGKIPFCYSITPFLLWRAAEVSRLYLDHEKIAVKLVGGGRDRDYGHLGFSHWAEDDQKIMACFENIEPLRPENDKELERDFQRMLNENKPFYINLRKE